MQKILTRLKSYFKAQIIGSFLLVREGLLDIDDINDIDVMITADMKDPVRAFLIDEGWTETESPKTIKHDYDRDKHIEGSLIFQKEAEKDIHLCIASSMNVWDTGKIIEHKFNRAQPSDIQQIIKVCQGLLN